MDKYQRTPFSHLLALACIAISPGPGFAETVTPSVTLEVLEVGQPPPARATVLSGRFSGNAVREIAAIYRDGAGHAQMRLYVLEDIGWRALPGPQLPDGTALVDVLRGSGQDRLLIIHDGHLALIDPFSPDEPGGPVLRLPYMPEARQEPYGDAETLDPSHGSAIPRLRLSQDLNGDGLDDIVLPDFSGFHIAVQLDNGAIGEFSHFGPEEPMLDHRAYASQSSYRQAGLGPLTLPWYMQRLHRLDHDGDGLTDLMFWNQDHFEVHHQVGQGRFDPVPYRFTTEVLFDADGVYTLPFAFEDEGTLGLLTGMRARSRFTMLRAIRDLNGDGVADLLVQTLEGRSLLRQRSVYTLHHGFRTPDGTRFAADPAAVLKPRGKAGGLVNAGYSSYAITDLDGDSRMDFMFRDVATGPLGMARAVVGNAVPIDLWFYPQRATGFPAEAATWKIRRFAPLSGRGKVFFPPVMVGDVSGDGQADLIYGQDPGTLHIHAGTTGPDLFDRLPVAIGVDLPADERNSWLEDLNGDGTQDVIIHFDHSEGHDDTAARLVTLISR